MTQQEALQEAQRRWGQEAVAIAYPQGICEVNSNPYSKKPWVYGTGNSWEAAFADADRRENSNE